MQNKKATTSKKGRKCKHVGCRHILSIYNHDIYCRVHVSQGGGTFQARGRK